MGKKPRSMDPMWRSRYQSSVVHDRPWRARCLSMKRSLMRTPEGWLLEIRLAIKDAREIEQFSPLIGQRITDANLFHLAPLVCLKFRGRKLVGREADRVTETALANYVVNSDPEGWTTVLNLSRCWLSLSVT